MGDSKNKRPRIVNAGFTAVDGSVSRAELERNRARLAQVMDTADPAKARYIKADGTAVGYEEWVGK